MTDHTTDIAPTIYTATTPAELRDAVLDLCCAAISEARYYSGRTNLRNAEAVVPPVPPVWREIIRHGYIYRCANGVLQWRQANGKWTRALSVDAEHVLDFADLIANPTGPRA